MKAGDADSTWLTFDVEVALRGATANAPIIPALPQTGVAVGLLVGAAIGLVTLGAWLLLSGRRRDRCEGCDAELEPGDHWAVRLFPGADQQILRDNCYAAYGAGRGLLATRLSRLRWSLRLWRRAPALSNRLNGAAQPRR